MIEVTCSYCGRKYQLESENDRPEFCEHCNTPLSDASVQEISGAPQIESNSRPQEVVLTYQKTGEEIRMRITDKVILGRENFGKEVLGNIPQISRAHCSIEFRDNELIVNDLNSTNGTFVGLDKIDCQKHPDQCLKDGDLLQLGREIFLTKVVFGGADQTSQTQEGQLTKAESTPSKPKVVKYRCKACGRIFDEKFDICPNDNSFGTMEEVVTE